jgi:hypothetical protein
MHHTRTAALSARRVESHILTTRIDAPTGALPLLC